MIVMGMKKKSRKDISKRYRGDGLGRVHIADSGMVWKKTFLLFSKFLLLAFYGKKKKQSYLIDFLRVG